MVEHMSTWWSWYISVPTILGIVGCAWLVWANTHSAKGDAPETMGHVWDEDLQEYNNPLPKWWLNMFYITLIFGALYLLVFPGLGNFKGLLGWTQIDQYERELAAADEAYAPIFNAFAATEIPALATDTDAMASGRRIYSSFCSTCHGADARGATGFPNLHDDDWLWGGEPEAIKTTILGGRQAAMPGWGAPLGDEGVAQVTEFVLSLAGRDHDSSLAGEGKRKYLQFCVACHGADGGGNQALGAANLTDDIWLYGGSSEAIATSIAEGRNGRMPAFETLLGKDKVHLVSAYVYSLRRQ